MPERKVYRDAGDGKFITKREADGRPKETVVKETVKYPPPPKRKK